MFQARALRSDDARVAYPLVACRYPAVTLPRWLEYVEVAQHRGSADSLVCLVDARDRYHAIFVYRVVASATSANRLLVAHIAIFQLIGDAIHRALHAALEDLAQRHACREVVIEPWAAVGGLDGQPRAGFAKRPASQLLTIDSNLKATGTLN